MDEDFDDFLEWLEENMPELVEEVEEDQRQQPRFRAVIVRGRLLVRGWADWMARGGALGNMFRGLERRGVVVADLILLGDQEEEIVVRFLAAGPKQAEAEEILIKWAGHLGYRRLWLPDRVVDIRDGAIVPGTASVRCPTCRSDWSDSNPEFWIEVRDGGTFPTSCPLCGGELPQWAVKPAGLFD
jgi:hypothetical protein